MHKSIVKEKTKLFEELGFVSSNDIFIKVIKKESDTLE